MQLWMCMEGLRSAGVLRAAFVVLICFGAPADAKDADDADD